MTFENIEHLLAATPTQHRHHCDKKEKGGVGGAERVNLVAWKSPNGSVRVASIQVFRREVGSASLDSAVWTWQAPDGPRESG